MQSTIAEMIAERSDRMTAGERRAAQTLVANYPLIGLKTVADFSQQAGVSSPTILRFVARLGFQNYADFQNRLQEELAAQLQSPSSRVERGGVRSARDLPPTIDATVENIRETFRHVSARQLAEAVGPMASMRNKLFLLGGRFTDPIARYMAAHLTLIRPGVIHLAGQESTWRDRLVDMGKRDCLLVFDIRRYQEGLLTFTEKANKRGVQIILVTDGWLSPIARFARHVIATRTEVPSAWDSCTALFVVAETLIGETTRRLDADGARRMSEIERLRSGET
ncbi:MAG: MurR/RpiR family transcriptional regulator [Rhizobiales bacterium]|nr:MurR/RpiR family transcriptional regulator [Hyphomicrobiales bacterium]